VTDVDAIPSIGHREAMTQAETETRRLLNVVDSLDEPDWSQPTDCTEWDVKALLSHVLGNMKFNATTREMIRQFRLATKAAKRSGRPMIDEMNARQVAEHVGMSEVELVRALHELGPRAVRARRRTPAPMRAMKIRPGPPISGTVPFGYLVDVIFNRDLWMHRIDLTRATGREHVATTEHDGRIVADVVSDWARSHGQPFTLTLEGPAGGTFTHGEHGVDYRLDAVEFCRILGGRAEGSGLLNHSPFRDGGTVRRGRNDR
jgi:uncharacterized protein (TIGR03083 family)